MDFKAQLEDIKKKINLKKIEQAKLEQQLDDLDKEAVNLANQMKELGIADMDSLEKEIAILEDELAKGFAECQKMLN